MSTKQRWNNTERENRSTWRRTYPSVTYYTTNFPLNYLLHPCIQNALLDNNLVVYKLLSQKGD